MPTTKEIQAEIDKLHGEIAQNISSSALSTPTVLKCHARILDLTAQLADISSGRLERRTNWLIYLTWAIVALTLALLVTDLIRR